MNSKQQIIAFVKPILTKNSDFALRTIKSALELTLKNQTEEIQSKQRQTTMKVLSPTVILSIFTHQLRQTSDTYKEMPFSCPIQTHNSHCLIQGPTLFAKTPAQCPKPLFYSGLPKTSTSSKL